jgi:hypothetical protein
MSLRVAMGAGVLLLGLGLPAPAQTSLQWQFKQGDKFFIEVVTKIDQKVTVADAKPVTSSRTFTTVSSFAVKKADADAYELEQVVEGVKVTPDKPAEANDVAARFANQLKGATFTFTINRAGKITSKTIEGYDALISKLSGGNAAAAQQARALLPEDDLREELGAIFGFLPDKPVSKGDTWARPESLTLPWGTLKGEATYTYQGKGAGGEEIAVRRKLTYGLPKEGTSGVKVTKGTLQVDRADGSIVVDPAAGKLVSNVQNMHLAGKLTMTDASMKDLTFDVDQTTTRTIKRVDKNPLAD